MIPYWKHKGTRAKDGWNGFDLEPSPFSDLHVYIEDDDGGYWISNGVWDGTKKELKMLDGPLGFCEGNPRALFWRIRPDPPTPARIKSAKAKPAIPHRNKYTDRVKPGVAQGPGEVLSYGDWETVET